MSVKPYMSFLPVAIFSTWAELSTAFRVVRLGAPGLAARLLPLLVIEAERNW